MGKKYIIELEEPEMFDERKYYQCSQMPWWAVSENIVENLTPYTEPDLEQVRKEAYADGYKTAKIRCGIQAEKDLREVGKMHYQRGLSDAWEAVRKIIKMPEGDLLNIFTECYLAVHTTAQVFLKYDASECIEKIRQYEKEKEEIKIGDEVITASGKAVVMGVGPVHFEYFNADGSGYDAVKYAKKTGRHFPEIAEVLAKMKEET